MYLFKTHMEIDNVFYRLLFSVMIVAHQSLHLTMYIFGRTCILSANFIGQTFIIAYNKPVFTAARCARFQEKMKLLSKGLRHWHIRMVNDVVYATEMINCLNNVIHIDGLISHPDGICLKDISCLIMSQTATFDMVRIVGHINLCSMVDAPF